MLFHICLIYLFCNALASPKWHLKSSLVKSLVEDYVKKEMKNELKRELEIELKDVLNDPSTSNFCVNLPDGDYVDPDTCSGFIKCAHQTTFKFPCPASGLYYDPNTNRCEYNTRCIDGKIRPLCEGKPDGNYRYPTECASYITCTNGEAKRRACAKGLAYDAQKRRCIAEDLAQCTIKSTTETCTHQFARVYVKGETWYQHVHNYCLQHTCIGQDKTTAKDLCPPLQRPDCSKWNMGATSVNFTPKDLPQCLCRKIVCCTNIDCTTTIPESK